MIMVVFWLAFKVEPSLRGHAMLLSVIVFDLGIIALCVEMINSQVSVIILLRSLELAYTIFQFEELRESMYNISWYEWTPSKRRNLVLFLGYLQRAPQMIAIIEPFNLEWFGNFLNKSYSTGCTLTKMI